MLKSSIFYLMILLLMSGAFSGMMIISQASAVGMEMIGLSVAAAGIAVSVLALFNSFGRILAGFLSDKIGRVQTLTLACFLSVGGNVLLYLCGKGDLILFYIGISIVGIASAHLWAYSPDLRQISLARRITVSTMVSCLSDLRWQGISDRRS